MLVQEKVTLTAVTLRFKDSIKTVHPLIAKSVFREVSLKMQRCEVVLNCVNIK